MQKSITIPYEELPIEALTKDDRELISNAKEALLTAYCPYSKFHVGAAVRLESGAVVRGSNQENAAYPSGLCAERVALFAAGAQYPGMAVATLAVVGAVVGPAGIDYLPALPCGACRQVMAETESRQCREMRILAYRSESEIWIFSGVESLLPFAFSM